MQQPGKTINDVYDQIFRTMDALENKKIDIHEANAMAQLAQTAINLGKLECKFIDTVGGKGTGFMPDDQGKAPPGDRLRLIARPR